MPTVEQHGDFEIYHDQVLGRGGMGTVVMGRQVSLDRPIAVKLLTASPEANPDVVTRFQREARITAMLDPACSIVAVYGTWEHDGKYYIAMEYVDGSSLRDLLLSCKRPPLGAALEIAHRVAVALKEAHAKNVLHRDLKPGNVMLTRSGAVKVVDFGIGKILGGSTALTHTGVLGTPHYMSPEQARGQAVDHRTDIYALGCILYELVTGRPPFTGDSAMAILYACVHETAPAPRSVEPLVPEELETVILTCLEKDPAKRYQDVAVLETQLAQLKAKVPVGLDWKTGETTGASQPGTTLMDWLRQAPKKPVLEKTIVIESGTSPPQRGPAPSSGGTGVAVPGTSGSQQVATGAPATGGGPPPDRVVPPTVTPPSKAKRSFTLVLAAAILLLAGAGLGAILLKSLGSDPPAPPDVSTVPDPKPTDPVKPPPVPPPVEDPEAAKRRAEVEARLKAEAEAKRKAEEAATKRRADAQALWDAAQADRQAKRIEEAKRKLERFVATYPDLPQAAEARTLIPALVRKGLRLETNPPGATIYLNGKKLQDASPVFLEGYPGGEYEILFFLKGHEESRRKASHREGEDTLVRVDLDPLRGHLVVKGLLPKARVALLGADGLPVRPEATPTDGVARLEGVPVGSYTLRVTLERHRTVKQPVELKPRETADVTVTLHEMPGEILILSDPPGGTVFLDGEEKGKSPLELKQIVPGTHALRIVHPERSDYEGQLEVRGLSNPPREIKLPARARLLLRAHPSAGTTARVETAGAAPAGVASRPLGGTELAIPVKAGAYTVTFSHAEAGTQSRPVRVLPGEDVTIVVDLWAEKAKDLEGRQDWDGAIAAYGKSLEPAAGKKLAALRMQAQQARVAGLQQEALAALKAGRSQEAEAKLAEFLKAKPDDMEAAGWLALAKTLPADVAYVGRNAQGFEECRSAKDGSTMVLIPAGAFTRGRDDGARDERPPHAVYVDAFLMDKTEVTWAQYKRFCDATGREAPRKPSWGFQETFPVVYVTWDDAAAYCAWAGKRLPTEAEWEKGARGLGNNRWPWGDTWDTERANTKLKRLEKPTPVGSFPTGASFWGLMDMAGNASEWCADRFYIYPRDLKGELRNPTGPAEGKTRVVRGGSWREDDELARCSRRRRYDQDDREWFIGFRCVKDARK